MLSKALELGKTELESGQNDATKVIKTMVDFIEKEPLARIDYVKIVDALTMQQVDIVDREVLVAMAVYIGNTRLIDNFMF